MYMSPPCVRSAACTLHHVYFPSCVCLHRVYVLLLYLCPSVYISHLFSIVITCCACPFRACPSEYTSPLCVCPSGYVCFYPLYTPAYVCPAVYVSSVFMSSHCACLLRVSVPSRVCHFMCMSLPCMSPPFIPLYMSSACVSFFVLVAPSRVCVLRVYVPSYACACPLRVCVLYVCLLRMYIFSFFQRMCENNMPHLFLSPYKYYSELFCSLINS